MKAESTYVPRRRLVTHTIRTRDGGEKTMQYNLRKAVALACTECMGFELHPDACTARFCPLWPFRAKTMASQHGDSAAEIGAPAPPPPRRAGRHRRRQRGPRSRS